MREKTLEQKLIKAVRQSGGLALKFLSPNFNGVPDRLLLFPGGRMVFCEVKVPGQKPRPLQEHRIAQLRTLGFKVFVLDNPSQIEGIISHVIPRFEMPGERASGSFSVENGRKPRARVEGSPSHQIMTSQKGEPSEI